MFVFSRTVKLAAILCASLALMSTSQAKSNLDSCEQIYRNWKGIGHIAYTNGSCEWEANVSFTKQGQAVSMVYHFYNLSGNHPACEKKEGDIIKTINCENGLLSYDTGTGIISEGQKIILNFLDRGGLGESILKR